MYSVILGLDFTEPQTGPIHIKLSYDVGNTYVGQCVNNCIGFLFAQSGYFSKNIYYYRWVL